ncbi:MAG TPA: BrnT family toxin [Rhizobiales bacterium]|nr:BrnT family toxin [Hyphomicrobiales bacterium]
MNLEWDENKRRGNLEKHGVDFIDAAKIFINPVLEGVDDRRNYGEKRMVAVGVFEKDWFVVVYTMRGKNRRIISAWKAGKDEQREYHAALSG